MASAGVCPFAVCRTGWDSEDAWQWGADFLPMGVGEVFLVQGPREADGWIKLAALDGGRCGWAPAARVDEFSLPVDRVVGFLLQAVHPQPPQPVPLPSPTPPPPSTTPPPTPRPSSGSSSSARSVAAESALPDLTPRFGGAIREFYCDGSRGNSGELGFTAAVVEAQAVVEHPGDFGGPFPAEIVGAQLGLDAVERAVLREPRVAVYCLRIDNSAVVDFLNGKQGLTGETAKFKHILVHVRRNLDRVRELASPAEVQIKWVDGRHNAAHGLAYGQLQSLRGRGWRVAEPIECDRFRRALNATYLAIRKAKLRPSIVF